MARKAHMANIGQSSERRRTALVLIPGVVNYFYNLAGRRIAEALEDLSFDVHVGMLDAVPATGYDWCLLSNISEVIHGFGNHDAAVMQLRRLQQSCGLVTSLLIDCVETPWYRRLEEYCRAAHVESILDLSLHNQGRMLRRRSRVTYHHLPAGLTTSEIARLTSQEADDEHRTIPWAYVCHHTCERAALIDYLVRHIDPRGFVYMPACAPYTEKGSPHLNQQQFEQVLRRTRYHIWSSHHAAFYMENERFRMSLLAGAVPIKVLSSQLENGIQAPFRELMIELPCLAERLRGLDFQQTRASFAREFQAVPPLTSGLRRFLASKDIIGGAAAAPLPSDAGGARQAA
jgi:hypothetical protein